MVYRKRNVRTRRVRRRRVVRRRRMPMARRTRTVRSSPTLIARSLEKNPFPIPYDDGSFVSQSTYGSFSFSLADVPNYQEFLALFQSYRLCGIKVSFFLDTGTSLSPKIHMPILHTAIDYNTTLFGTAFTLNGLYQMSTYKRSFFTSSRQMHSRYLKPRVQSMIYESTTSTGYTTSRRSAYITMNDNTVPHYGLIWYVEHPNSYQTGEIANSAQPMYMRVYVKYYFAFKGIH